MLNTPARKTLVACFLGSFFLLTAARPQTPAWKPLFNGKDLTGWNHVGPGSMTVEDGLIRTEGGMGLLWYTRETFGDATIRVVYKTTDKASNSGIFIRIDGKPKDECPAVHQLLDVAAVDHESVRIFPLPTDGLVTRIQCSGRRNRHRCARHHDRVGQLRGRRHDSRRRRDGTRSDVQPG